MRQTPHRYRFNQLKTLSGIETDWIARAIEDVSSFNQLKTLSGIETKPCTLSGCPFFRFNQLKTLSGIETSSSSSAVGSGSGASTNSKPFQGLKPS